MNPSDQILGAGTTNWAEMRLKVALAKEYDLGKFLFTVATATVGFLFTAEKMNPAAAWEWRLIIAFLVLLAAIVLSVVMVMAAAPEAATDAPKVSARTSWQVQLWFGLWGVGSALGVWAVLPS